MRSIEASCRLQATLPTLGKFLCCLSRESRSTRSKTSPTAILPTTNTKLTALGLNPDLHKKLAIHCIILQMFIFSVTDVSLYYNHANQDKTGFIE